MDGNGVSRIVLVGFMAAGKTTIAPLLAQALRWRVLDVDSEIEALKGCTIAEFIRSDGLDAFRELEAELTARLSSGEGIVVSPGGGWVTGPGYDDVVKDVRTRTVWLRISIEEALRRVEQDPVERPLLAGADPKGQASRLLAEREPFYAAADLTIDVDGRTAESVVDDIVEWLKTNIS